MKDVRAVLSIFIFMLGLYGYLFDEVISCMGTNVANYGGCPAPVNRGILDARKHYANA